MEERFHFRYVNAITGTFVLVVVLALIAGVVWTGRSQRWFKGTVTLWIILPETGAAGIRQGSEVYFLGTLVGSVADVVVDSDGLMQAEANLRRDFFQFIRADSSAVVNRTFGMVGDAYFEITRGHGRPLPEKHASIVCHETLPSALENAIEEIRREAVPALKQLRVGLGTWSVLGSNLMTSRESLEQLIRRGDGIVMNLQEGKGTLGKLLTDRAAVDELEKLLLKANRSMDELQVTLNHLQQASANLQEASTHLPAIGGALGTEAKDLSGLILQTQQTLHEIERLVAGLQRHWLIRNCIQPYRPETRIPPSEVAP